MTSESDDLTPPLNYRSVSGNNAEAGILQPLVIIIDVAVIATAMAIGTIASTHLGMSLAFDTSRGANILTLDFLLGIAGAVYSGWRAPAGRRGQHLAWVTVGLWVAGLSTTFCLGIPLAAWPIAVVYIAAFMGLGGLLTKLIRLGNERG